MKKLTGRDLKVITLLSVVVPVSLLVSFRLAGVLQPPITIAETIPVQPVFWELEKPSDIINLGEVAANSFDNGEVAVSHTLHIYDYDDTSVRGPEEVGMGTNITASVNGGFVVSLNLTFCEDYTQSSVWFVGLSSWLDDGKMLDLNRLENLSIREAADWQYKWHLLRNNTKAWLTAIGVDAPARIHLEWPILWLFRSAENQTPRLHSILELTYFNGTAFKKVVLPVIVRLLPDQAGNDFSTAKLVTSGNYSGYVSYLKDRVDYYRIWVNKEQTLVVTLSQIVILVCDYDLYLFDPQENLVSNSTRKGVERTLEIAYKIPDSGYWYIEVDIPCFYGCYSLELSLSGRPLTPSKPYGTVDGYTRWRYVYSTSTIDPDGATVQYVFDLGDGTTTTTDYVPSNQSVSASHTWTYQRGFPIKVQAKDSEGKWSNWSEELLVNIKERDCGGAEPQRPSQPTGPHYGLTYVYYGYETVATDPDGDNIQYVFDWGDGTLNVTYWHASGVCQTAYHYWKNPGTYQVKVQAQDARGNCGEWSESLTVTISWLIDGGGGGGCPYVLTWNGSQYVFDNNLIPAAEYSNGTDVIDYYLLQQLLVHDDGKYSLVIWDLDKHSFLDKVELVAVDRDPDVNVAISPYCEILTYTNPTSPSTAFNENETNILELVGSQDSQYYQGHAGDYIELYFNGADVRNGAKLVIRSDPAGCDLNPCLKSPVYIQTLNSSGLWQTVATIYTRLYWATDIIDLSSYLPDADGELKVRLCFTSSDRIDFIGLDTTQQGEYKLRYANLAMAMHTGAGDVKGILRQSDDQRAELLPGESIRLDFTLPQNPKQKRDFIIILEGHYLILN